MDFSRRFFLTSASFALAAGAFLPCGKALAIGDPKQPIAAFYDTLVKSMQSNGDVAARFTVLSPTINRVFDIATMTKIVIGPTWTGLPGVKKDEAIEVFRTYIITSYASRFKKFTNQRFELQDAKDAGNKRMLVTSKLIRPGEDDIQFNYLVWPVKDQWKIIDIYLGGSISEMARLRSEFSEVIQNNGIDALIVDLKKKTEELTKGA